MFLSLLLVLVLLNTLIQRTAAATTAPLRSPRLPPRTTFNSNGASSAKAMRHGVDVRKNEMPNIDILVDHAEFALNSYLPSSEILKTLRRTKSNVRIIQRTLDHVGASYNIIQYSDKSNENVRWVISIPGSRNNKNYQQNMDNKLVLDDVINIKVHRGYRSVYRAILADFISEESRMRGLFGGLTGENGGLTEVPKSRISLSVTGHSLGGAVSCLFAAALQKRGYNIEHVTVFGTPKFTDKIGADKLVEMLPIERVEHVRDPVSISPMGMPIPFPFADNYADLESEILLVLEPSDKNDIKNNKKEFESGSDISINLLQSVLSNPLSALSEFNWRGERMMEQLQKHKVYAGREAFKRTGMFLRMGDVLSIHWQWHSMRAYHMLLKEHQAEYRDILKKAL